jgi:hypothetical protein
MKRITILAVVAALMLAVVGGTAIAESGSGKSGSGGGKPGSGGGNSGKKMVTYNFFGTVTEFRRVVPIPPRARRPLPPSR